LPHQASVEDLRAAIESFPGTSWVSCGVQKEAESQVAWVKFGVKKSELGWRTIEFIAWLYTDMSRAGERVFLFPTAPPPYLNEPGQCLSYVLEVHAHDGGDLRVDRVSQFVQQYMASYWAECQP
jgi:hypothetical protein